ncbi:hypothetical protein HYC85_021804 [Camellia sinensis]|uniref:Uncharacterized protein n=1 Tax=Camellia sinensis TaxID=4442 RepID=A0A7J7GJH0_CAMSI|nr:hypothetical protein HYC85_021804 [Camellia sinensis]
MQERSDQIRSSMDFDQLERSDQIRSDEEDRLSCSISDLRFVREREREREREFDEEQLE